MKEVSRQREQVLMQCLQMVYSKGSGLIMYYYSFSKKALYSSLYLIYTERWNLLLLSLCCQIDNYSYGVNETCGNRLMSSVTCVQ